MLSPLGLAVFWYQILLSPICLCIYFHVWFYFTWPHLFTLKVFCMRFPFNNHSEHDNTVRSYICAANYLLLPLHVSSITNYENVLKSEMKPCKLKYICSLWIQRKLNFPLASYLPLGWAILKTLYRDTYIEKKYCDITIAISQCFLVFLWH